MFEDFTVGDIGKYIAAHRLVNNFELVKSSFVDQVEDVKPEAQPELFKNFEYGQDYNQNLNQRREELKNGVPIHNLAKSIEIPKEELPVFGDSVFPDIADGAQFDPYSLVKHNQQMELEDTPTTQIWRKEVEPQMLSKSISIISDIYHEVVEIPGIVSESDIKGALMQKGYKDKSIDTLTKFLLKMHMYNQVFDDIESGMPETTLVKKYAVLSKFKLDAKDPSAIAAKIGRKKKKAKK